MRGIEASLGAVLVAVCRAHRNRAAALFAPVGVYVGQEWILFRLRESGSLTPSELSIACDVEAPTMTRALQRMERAGVLVRGADEDDARVARLSLTRDGRALCNEVERLWGELERATVAGFTVDERTTLRRLLLDVRHNLG